MSNKNGTTLKLPSIDLHFEDLGKSYKTQQVAQWKEQQEVASSIVQMHIKALSPTTPTVRNNNLEELYKSLKNAAADSYEALALEEPTEELTIRPNYTPRSVNGCGSGGDINSKELVKRILAQCVKGSPTSQSEKQNLLSQLISVINCGDIEPVIGNFRLFRTLNHLMESDEALQIVVLQVFTAVCKSQDALLKEWRNQFVELPILRVLALHMSEKPDVVKMAEETAAAMCVFPFETTASVLWPVIATGEHPIMQGAIKMLTKLIEMHPGEVTDSNLDSFIPGLIKVHDHEDISVQKSAVFCMIEVHKAVGKERMAPYIASLPDSTLKPLWLYFTCAQDLPVQNSQKN